LVIFGLFLENVLEIAQSLVGSDQRKKYIGWRTPDEIKAPLRAADIISAAG
jgi:hypothetical protein